MDEGRELISSTARRRIGPARGAILAAIALAVPTTAAALDVCLEDADALSQLFTDCGEASCTWQLTAAGDYGGGRSIEVDLPAGAEHRVVGGYEPGCVARIPDARSTLGDVDVSMADGSARMDLTLESLVFGDLSLLSRENPTSIVDVEAASLDLETNGVFAGGAGAPIAVTASRFAGPVSIRTSWKGTVAVKLSTFEAGAVSIEATTLPRTVRFADNTVLNGFVAPGGIGAAGLTLDFGDADVTASISRNRFQDNWTWEDGAALSGTLGGGTVDVDANVFQRNGAWGDGGAIHFELGAGSLRLLHNLLQENVAATGASGGGGAFVSLNDDAGSLVTANNILRGNVADVFGVASGTVGRDLVVLADGDANGTDGEVEVVTNAIGEGEDSLRIVAVDPLVSDNVPGTELDLTQEPDPMVAGLNPRTYDLPRRSRLIDGGVRIKDWKKLNNLGGRARVLGPAPDIGPAEAAPLTLAGIGEGFGETDWDHLAMACRDPSGGVPGGCALYKVHSVEGTSTTVSPDLVRAGIDAVVTAIVPVPSLGDGVPIGVAWLELDQLSGEPQTRLRVRDLEGNPASRWLQTLPYQTTGELLLVDGDDLAEPLLVTTGYINGRINVVVYEADAPLVDEFPLVENNRWTLGPAAAFADDDASRACVSLLEDDGRLVVQCLSLAAETLDRRMVVFGSGWRPLAMVNAGDLNGDGRGEALLLAGRIDDDRFGFFTLDLAARSKLNKRTYSKKWQPLGLGAHPTAGPSVAFLAHRRSDGRPLQRLVDPLTGALNGDRAGFESGWRGRAIAVRGAPVENGSPRPQSVALGIDSETGEIVVERRNANSRLLNRTTLEPPEQPPAN